MSRDDRSRRVWRLLERGWTSARALRDALQEVRGKVDEARVRLSDEVVSRLAGQPVRTQDDPSLVDPNRDDSLSAARPPRPSPALQEELARAANLVSDDAVAVEASKNMPPPNKPSPSSAAPTPVPQESAAAPAPESPSPAVAPPQAKRAPQEEVVMLARDAEWVFVYWTLDADRIEAARAQSGDLHFLLRIFQAPHDGLVHQSAAAVPSGRRYVRVPFADTEYSASLWARKDGEEVLLVKSASVGTPPAIPRPSTDAAMMSSMPHRSVLNSAWDLSRVPRLQPEAVPPVPRPRAVVDDAPSEAAPPAAPEVPVAAETVELEFEAEEVFGSESRLRRRTVLVPGPNEGPTPPDHRRPFGADSEGSEDRLGGGSEDRLGGSEGRLGGSESRLGGSEQRLGSGDS